MWTGHNFHSRATIDRLISGHAVIRPDLYNELARRLQVLYAHGVHVRRLGTSSVCVCDEEGPLIHLGGNVEFGPRKEDQTCGTVVITHRGTSYGMELG